MISRGFKGWQARTTCSTRVRPPARCSTFASADFSRVPLPAASTTTTGVDAGDPEQAPTTNTPKTRNMIVMIAFFFMSTFSCWMLEIG